jgi:hypothetical protein
MEATPLYEIIPSLHQIRRGERRERKVPQTNADFLVTYVDDEGPHAPSLVDVKSRLPKRKEVKKKMGWQITAAMRRGFIFQVAYLKNQIQFPRVLSDWEIRTHEITEELDRGGCSAQLCSFVIRGLSTRRHDGF